MLFRNIQSLIDTVNQSRRPVDAGTRKSRAPDIVKLAMQVVVSLVVLATGCYLVAWTNSSESQKTGYALIGIVTGYWLA